jgi:hypothetical protein
MFLLALSIVIGLAFINTTNILPKVRKPFIGEGVNVTRASRWFRTMPSLSPSTDPPEEKTVRYHKKQIVIGNRKDSITVEHDILDSFMIYPRRTYHYCLPNYFIRGDNTSRPKYRNGTAVFMHHHKAGGTTMKSCLNAIIGKNPRNNGGRQHRFIETLHLDKRLTWSYNWNQSQRLMYDFISGGHVMGICNDLDPAIRPCSYFTMLRDPIEREVTSYFYCQVDDWDALCSSRRLHTRRTNIKQWALHQRSYLFTQLTYA